MKDFITRFTSRKFLLALLGVLVAFGVPMSDGQLISVTSLIIAFTMAEGVADVVQRRNEAYKIAATMDLPEVQ